MSDLQKRVKALEERAGLGDDRITVIVRTFVRPGPNGPQETALAAFASHGGGWRIDREPGEGREAFIDRASAAVPRPSNGVGCLVEVLA